MSTFVLVHGMSHGGWAWRLLTARLERAGHRVTLALLTPQPLAPCAERVDYQRFFAMRVPCTYIRCLRDAAVPPERAAQYAARLGVAPIDMDCAHGPMLSDPDALAKILESVGAQHGR
jgi:pimeloyl-ACP methyl ester carboxylesterase